MQQHFDTTLPEDFDGVFRFTNRSNEEFVGKWDSKEYRFPPNSTSPMLIMNATPLETQSIRKKFAKDWAIIQYFKSAAGKKAEGQERNPDGTPKFNSIHMAGSYTDNDLKPFIQMCLEPLPEAKAVVTEAPKQPLEEVLTRDEEGELRTQVVDRKTSLRKKALES